MAVSVLNTWATINTGDPNNVQTISSGAGERLAVLVWTAEHSGQVSHSQMAIGGISFTSKVEQFWDNGSADQHVYMWWWNEAAIASFADNDIDSEDGVSVTKQAWSFIVLDGVDQTTPMTTQVGNDTSSNTINVSSTSTSNDYDIVGVSRSSGNRNITGWDTLTEGFQGNVNFTGAAGGGAGGDATITVTGDGTADDFTWAHAIVNEAAGLTDVNLRGTSRGVMRGIGRGIG